MIHRNLCACLIVMSGGALAAPRADAQSCSRPYFVEQSFPSAGPAQTSWRICWQGLPGWGVVITSAHFRKAPGAPWMRLFWDARVTEIFVPYHTGNPRYYDLSGFGFGLHSLTTSDCPASANGTLLGTGNEVCKELRPRGLAWKDNVGVRRGEELVLWGAIAAANYSYIVEWSFRDDGVVIGRVGATGANLPTRPWEAHMHNAMWRLDIDLNGFWGDAVYLGRHHETPPALTATDTEKLVPNEAALSWSSLRFDALHIHDGTLRNGRNHPSAFHLTPLRAGSGRHAEPWTRNDFWITRYAGSAEMRPANLPSYITPAQSVNSADVVVWYWGSIHHLTRDEDGTETTFDFSGVAQVMWGGFMLKPHNLFDGPPLWP